jgi:hypothetical protein
MNNTVPYMTAVCMQYEILLKACQAALEACDDRHEAIDQSRVVGKEVDDELLRLQAGYARACAVLRRHVRGCEVCQFFAKSSAHNSDHGSPQALEEGYPLEESPPSPNTSKRRVKRRTRETNSGAGAEQDAQADLSP